MFMFRVQFALCVFFCDFVPVLFAFVMLGLVSSGPSQEIG